MYRSMWQSGIWSLYDDVCFTEFFWQRWSHIGGCPVNSLFVSPQKYNIQGIVETMYLDVSAGQQVNPVS